MSRSVLSTGACYLVLDLPVNVVCYLSCARFEGTAARQHRRSQRPTAALLCGTGTERVVFEVVVLDRAAPLVHLRAVATGGCIISRACLCIWTHTIYGGAAGASTGRDACTAISR